ncbi:MAG: hypothetical protein IJ867_08495 [Clostridia bacterium]|nr:hypothetical protein [Clostridia bacterium]
MEDNEIKLGEKFISGQMVSLDEEEVENLDKMSKSLKQVERNLKENIVSNMK